MPERVFNFSAGPAVMPLPVLEEAQRDLVALPGVGSSVMELSHRGKPYMAIHADAKARLVSLLNIPDTHDVLFLQGGSRLQFSMIPINLLKGTDKTADYIVTGSWGKKALEEAVKEGKTNVAWDGKSTNFNCLPKQGDLKLSSDAAYVHITSNETIQGVQFAAEPEVGNVPLVSDQSSDFMSRPVDVSKYGIIYACAQKNAGPAGVTVVIIRKDLMEQASSDLPGYLVYRNHAEADSMWNTPPTFGIYLLGLVCKWLQDDMGGLEKVQKQNEAKAQLLYDVIDQSNGFYIGHAVPEDRSKMNVTFKLGDDELDKRFLAEANAEGLTQLGGHRSVGGVRASIYNAMPVEGVEKLRDFMLKFKK
ncbi:3-phosphoserine/phosphohydroxythreonine transaminase [Blastopirellula marina]|uniref:Phosphoserine aminotransferase n=1 Tax=Blastopirellula marina TaxID=124 RepID=A0A2S8GTW7_9BACT|nr:3-phosphoserine/phosphohydroxythreonine transaminase [Blastopirellula marina]PQO47869.1 3-phosphoserine/phosphohydroxythreonine transaminase [Blastopirellula marina]